MRAAVLSPTAAWCADAARTRRRSERRCVLLAQSGPAEPSAPHLGAKRTSASDRRTIAILCVHALAPKQEQW